MEATSKESSRLVLVPVPDSESRLVSRLPLARAIAHVVRKLGCGTFDEIVTHLTCHGRRCGPLRVRKELKTLVRKGEVFCRREAENEIYRSTIACRLTIRPSFSGRAISIPAWPPLGWEGPSPAQIEIALRRFADRPGSEQRKTAFDSALNWVLDEVDAALFRDEFKRVTDGKSIRNAFRLLEHFVETGIINGDAPTLANVTGHWTCFDERIELKRIAMFLQAVAQSELRDRCAQTDTDSTDGGSVKHTQSRNELTNKPRIVTPRWPWVDEKQLSKPMRPETVRSRVDISRKTLTEMMKPGRAELYREKVGPCVYRWQFKNEDLQRALLTQE